MAGVITITVVIIFFFIPKPEPSILHRKHPRHLDLMISESRKRISHLTLVQARAPRRDSTNRILNSIGVVASAQGMLIPRRSFKYIVIAESRGLLESSVIPYKIRAKCLARTLTRTLAEPVDEPDKSQYPQAPPSRGPSTGLSSRSGREIHSLG